MQMPRLRLTLLIATAFFFVSQPARAGLRFAQNSVHLKATAEDQTLTTQFSFQNTGTEPIFVASLTTSCPCTTAQIEKPHIAPDENAVITVTYKIGASEGPQSQTVTLLTNEKEGATYTLTIKVDIPKRTRTELPRVVPVTPTLLFWSKKPFQTKAVKVDLRGIEDAKVSATCDNNTFKISLGNSFDKHEAVLEITPDACTTEARAELTIVIERGTEKIANHPVSLTVLAK